MTIWSYWNQCNISFCLFDYLDLFLDCIFFYSAFLMLNHFLPCLNQIDVTTAVSPHNFSHLYSTPKTTTKTMLKNVWLSCYSSQNLAYTKETQSLPFLKRQQIIHFESHHEIKMGNCFLNI